MAMQRSASPTPSATPNEQRRQGIRRHHRIIDEMKASGAMTIGELFEARRKNREEDRK
jgi:hypothetical protein